MTTEIFHKMGKDKLLTEELTKLISIGDSLIEAKKDFLLLKELALNATGSELSQISQKMEKLIIQIAHLTNEKESKERKISLLRDLK